MNESYARKASSTARRAPILDTLLAVWRWLTQPASSIRDPQQRRQAQFLAALLLILSPIGVLVAVLSKALNDHRPVLQIPDIYVAAAAITLALIAYRLSRTRYYRWSAHLTIVAASAGVFVSTVTDAQPLEVHTVYYFLLPVLLSSFLLPLSQTVILTVIQAVVLLLLPAFMPGTHKENAVLEALAAYTLMSAVTLVVSYQRNMLEKDRQADLEQQVSERTRELTELTNSLRAEVEERQHVEAALLHNNDFLESRVEARTAELSEAIQLLRLEITERERAEQAERQQRLIAEALRNTAAAVNSTLDLAEVLKRILFHIEDILPYDTATIMLLEDGIARVVAERGFETRGLQSEDVLALRFDIDQYGNLRTMYDSGQPYIIADTQGHPAWRNVKETAWIRSYLAAPIRSEGYVIGFINLDNASPDAFHEEQAGVLQAFADEAAIAIVNARLYEAVRRHADELEARVQERTLELERERAQLSAILDAASEGVSGVLLDNNGQPTIRYVNRALYEMVGYTAEEWDVSRLQSRGMSQEEAAALLADYEQQIQTQGFWHGEIKMRRKDGTEFDAELTTNRVDDSNGQAIGVVSVIRDISERKSIEAKQARFVANASHELRTPITNLMTRLYLLRRKPELMEQHLEILEAAVGRLRQLVEDLLDHSRFERGVIPLRPEQVDLRALVVDTVHFQNAEAEMKNIALIYRLPEAPLPALADPARITQVLTNLIVNAINYTPQGGTVNIEADCEPGKEPGQRDAVIRVRDSGPGIAPDALPHIFQPFYRASSGGRGAGLGLTIAKEIVDMHGGQISVDSVPGMGSCFTVRLHLETANSI